jgi:ABC-2 type transport system permease protein
MQGFHLLMNLALFPLLFFSGAFFPVDGLPPWLEALARINPLSYAVDAMLLAAYADGSDGYFGLAVDFVVLIALAVAAYAFGRVDGAPGSKRRDHEGARAAWGKIAGLHEEAPHL